mmetsp:Transcript_7668/g.10458  ORF Transcript_7668/g.10458 Transcript_7668/m.10458 type:complete len:98 (-) Transcript_7668:1548-1841(-)
MNHEYYHLYDQPPPHFLMRRYIYIPLNAQYIHDDVIDIFQHDIAINNLTYENRNHSTEVLAWNLFNILLRYSNKKVFSKAYCASHKNHHLSPRSLVD